MAYNQRPRQGQNFTPAEEAVLITLAYSDIFSFPLTKDELWKYLISKKKISRDAFNDSLKTLKSYIVSKSGFFCLKNREEIIQNRLATIPEVTRKLQKARLIAERLSLLSSVLFIGITGGLAVGNAAKHDDIDLVIITKKRTLFITRFLILLMLESIGVRRSRNQKNAADTICVNLLFDETALGWFTDRKDVYTAREISQISPLFERDMAYQNFLKANIWIQDFLPNSSYSANEFVKNPSVIVTRVTGLISNAFFESLARFLQMSWMRKHQTSEIVSKQVLAFHPVDYRAQTLEQLKLKMRQLGLLTKF